MTTALTKAKIMARKKVVPGNKPIGPILAKNLYRLGLADIVVRTTEVAELIAKETGRRITRQRISAIVNAVKVEQETIDLIAKAIGVDPSELTRDVEV